MEPSFWENRWREGQIGWHQQSINLHLQQFWPEIAAPQGGVVFVPLCGKSLDMAWLAGQGHRVLGVELSRQAAQDFFAEQCLHPEVTPQGGVTRFEAGEIAILQGDFFALTPADLIGVTAVFDRAALIALPPEMRTRYAAHMATLTPPGTVTLLVGLDYPQSEQPGPPFSVPTSEVVALFGANFEVTPLHEIDLLTETPRYRERGLSRIVEHVSVLRRR